MKANLCSPFCYLASLTCSRRSPFARLPPSFKLKAALAVAAAICARLPYDTLAYPSSLARMCACLDLYQSVRQLVSQSLVSLPLYLSPSYLHPFTKSVRASEPSGERQQPPIDLVFSMQMNKWTPRQFTKSNCRAKNMRRSNLVMQTPLRWP